MARNGRLGKRSDIQDARRIATLLNLTPAPGGSGSPVDVVDLTAKTFVVMSADAILTDERVLVAGAGLTLTDGGAGGNATIDVVAADTSILVNADNLQVNLATNSGMQVSSGLQLGTPSSITSSSTNSVTTTTHAHAADSSLARSAITLTTTSPLSGGGDLTTNRTLAVGGLSSLGTANYVVGVNSGATAWEYKQLVQGAGISITHGAGSVTIAATGGGGTVGGSGTAGRIAQWATGGANIEDSTLVKSGAGLLTLSAGGAYTFTVPATGTAVLTSRVLTAGNGFAAGSGGDLSADRTFTLGTPGSVTSSSTNAVTTNSHTHAADSTLARSSITLTAGAGLTGGGNLTANRTFDVGAGTLISVAADSVSLANGSAQYQVPVTGATPFTPAYTALSTFAGGGLVFSGGVFAVGAGAGLTVNADDVALTTPGTLSVSSTNVATGNHTHAITTAAQVFSPQTSAILRSDANGILTGLYALGIGADASGMAQGTIRMSGGSSVTQIRARANNEIVFQGETTNGQTLVRAAPLGSPTGIATTFQAFFTDWIADGTNYEAVEMLADRGNAVGWLRTTAGGTGTVRDLQITRGGTIDTGITLSSGLVLINQPVRSTGAFYANAETVVSMRMRTLTLANLATGAVLNDAGSGNETRCQLFIVDSTNANARFFTRASSQLTLELEDNFSVYSATSGTASSTNIYWSAANSRYEIENRRGVSVTYYILYMAAA